MNQPRSRHQPLLRQLGAAAALCVLVAACGGGVGGGDGGGGGGGGGSSSYTIAGSVTNLKASGLVLHNNAGDALSVPADATSFRFTTKVARGAAYAVTVATQPGTDLNNWQDCTIVNGSGTTNADVDNVQVMCDVVGPLTLVSASPAQGASAVARDVQPGLSFSSRLAPDSDQALVLWRDDQSVPFSAVITDKLATLRPSTKLLPATTYVARADKTELQGTRGEKLTEDVQVAFTTADGAWRAPTVASGEQPLTEANNQPFANLAVAVDAQGNVFAAWRRGLLDAGIVVNRFDAASGKWGRPQALRGEPGRSLQPVLAVDAAGNALVVWSQTNTATPSYTVIWGARYDRATAVWSLVDGDAGEGEGKDGIQALSHADGSNAERPVLTLAPDGTAILAWVRRDRVNGRVQDVIWWRSASNTGKGAWTNREVLSDFARQSVNHRPGLAAARAEDGRTMVVWSSQDLDDNGSPKGYTVIRAAVIPPNRDQNGIKQLGVISNNNADPEDSPAIAAARNDFQVIWQQQNKIGGDSFSYVWTVRVNSSDTRGTPQRVAGAIDQGFQADEPQVAGCALAIPACGTAHVVWREFRSVSNTQAVITARIGAGGVSGELRELGTRQGVGFYAPRIVMDHAGNAVAAWSEYASDSAQDNKHAARYRLEGAAGWGSAEVLATMPFGADPPLALAIEPRTGDAVALWQDVLDVRDGRASVWSFRVRRFD